MYYFHSADFSVIIISILLLFALRLVYTPKCNRLIYVKLALYNLIYCSILSILFHTIIYYNFNDFSEVVIYIINNSLQIGMITELVLYNLYLFDLIGLKQKRVKVLVLVIASIFSIVHLTSIFTHLGFYIENKKMHNVGVGSLYIISYIFGIGSLVLITLKKNRIIARHISISLGFTFIYCVGITINSYINNISSYILLTYLIPLIIMILLFHSNSFSSKLSTLGRDALESKIEDLIKENKPFYFIYGNIQDFQKIENSDKTVEDFNYLTKITRYNSFLFKYKNNTFIMLYTSDKYLDKFHSIFKSFHDSYNLSHQIFIIPSSDNCKCLQDYIFICKFLRQKYLYGIHTVSTKDLDEFKRSLYICHQLHDIVSTNNLEDERVLVYCQPILDVNKNTFTTAEALMRLKLPELGVVYPNDFISIAEHDGIIHNLTLIILNKVCRYLETSESIKCITINLSMHELIIPKFYSNIISIIQKYDISYNRLGFEITESVEISNFSKISTILSEFRKLGIKIYLDDFGTGYSNLERITKLPIDVVKFDRSLVVSAGESTDTKFMLEGVSNIFSIVGYKLLYEGIENTIDQERCISMQAEYLQGFKYAKPIPIEELDSFMKDYIN